MLKIPHICKGAGLSQNLSALDFLYQQLPGQSALASAIKPKITISNVNNFIILISHKAGIDI